MPEKEDKPHTIISKDEIILRDDRNIELVFGYNDSPSDYESYHRDEFIFYLEINSNENKEVNAEAGIAGIALTIDQLKNLVNTANKFLRELHLKE